MSGSILTASIGGWALALTAMVWLAVATGSLAAWAGAVCVALVVPLIQLVLANTPAKSMAEVIREVESRR